ncbi:hypothetical protein KP79_PYT07932 [Mizuhopecten yessoensis]|uniref:Uncharacterized protein n=1 Tax=Mizuhopecten yessoensis TaxID=6573 RepID=A0A210PIL6_MIZYE|nr:hypothetical protein KP79_PYT07932 [Mizuhopecten yessoensis]
MSLQTVLLTSCSHVMSLHKCFSPRAPSSNPYLQSYSLRAPLSCPYIQSNPPRAPSSCPYRQ